MTVTNFFAIIRRMINYTKKWWLLGCFRRAMRIHSTTGSNTGRRVLLSQLLFIEGDQNWPGLANKFNKYIRFRPSWLWFWKKEFNETKLKRNRYNYHELYEVCVKEGYIGREKGVDGNDWPTIATPKAHRISGLLGYFNGLIEEYPRVWLAVGALILALIGLIGSFLAGTTY